MVVVCRNEGRGLKMPNGCAGPRWKMLAVLILGVFPGRANAQRETLSLNGIWNIEDSVTATAMPKAYHHTVPVPGLAHSSTPAFADVDEFQSRELLSNLVERGTFPRAEYDKLGSGKGISHQTRNYFWYQKTFKGPRRHAVALLKISKAQFGIVVYLNGAKLGEHDPCFTAAWFDATKAIRWGAENSLVIRVGAHPGVLPANVSEGTDFEKNRWTPGIYDDVSVMAMDNPVIANVQVAPDLDKSQVIVQTEVHNYGGAPMSIELGELVTTWKGGTLVAGAKPLQVSLAGGESKVVEQAIAIPNAHLWSPEDPFLYQVVSRTRGDAVKTRFGMRDFHFDTTTQRAYLNGKPYFLRGSNITLHRFFEDPDSGTLPWNEAWLHKLLVEIPKKMHWNAFRFCIGPVPDRWLKIADESGLLIQNEYMVWVGNPGHGLYQSTYDPQELIGEYREWMRDNWNHPSVAIWDANNESVLPAFNAQIIPAVRGLDLSHRPWENSYNPPEGADDPVEDHPYLFYEDAFLGQRKFRMTDLESLLGLAPDPSASKSGHAMIVNEYGWLWLNRDGSPTLLTQKLYPLLLGPNSTAEQRFAMQAYLLAGETEFWRCYRKYAAVLHFVYLTASEPNAFTSDEFQDVKSLRLEPHFADYMSQAFKPLGLYINYWHTEMEGGADHDFTVLMINDDGKEKDGTLQLEFIDPNGRMAGQQHVRFHLNALGAQSYRIGIHAPDAPGKYTLEAVATASDNPQDPTLSRRWITVTEPGHAVEH